MDIVFHQDQKLFSLKKNYSLPGFSLSSLSFLLFLLKERRLFVRKSEFLIEGMHGSFGNLFPGTGPHIKGFVVVGNTVVVVATVVKDDVSTVIQIEKAVSSTTLEPHFADLASYFADKLPWRSKKSLFFFVIKTAKS